MAANLERVGNLNHSFPGTEATEVEPPMHQWQEIVESGVHEFHKDFGGVTLTITKLDIPNAWTCLLPDGKRVVGELRAVRDTVEMIMSRRGSAKSPTP